MSSCKLPCCAAGNSDAVGCRLMVFLIWCHQTYRHTYTARSRIFQCSHHSKSSLIQIAYASVVAAISTQVLAEAWSRLKHGDFSWSQMWRWEGSDLKFLEAGNIASESEIQQYCRFSARRLVASHYSSQQWNNGCLYNDQIIFGRNVTLIKTIRSQP
jgi:hypothetical protein